MMRFKEQINGPWDEARPDPALLKAPVRIVSITSGGMLVF
jgi:hypothetical protein